MKHCRIWFLHQNPDGPKNSKEFYELRFPGKYRFDFVNWDLIRKLRTCGRGFGWNKNCFEPCIRILRVRISQKKIYEHWCNSVFKVNFLRNCTLDFLYWTLKGPLYTCTGEFDWKNNACWHLHQNSDSPKVPICAINIDVFQHSNSCLSVTRGSIPSIQISTKSSTFVKRDLIEN